MSFTSRNPDELSTITRKNREEPPFTPRRHCPASQPLVEENESITPMKWLTLDVNAESISLLLRYLTLASIANALPIERALCQSRKYLGLVIASQELIDLTEDLEEGVIAEHKLYRSDIVENSQPTIALLNIKICKHNADMPSTALENYTESMFGKSGAGGEKDPNLYLQHVVPIAFAHNYVAKKFPPKPLEEHEDLAGEKENKGNRPQLTAAVPNQYIYPFVVYEGSEDEVEIAYITEGGELIPTKYTNVRDFLGKKGSADNGVQIIAIVENEIHILAEELEKKKRDLADLSSYSSYSSATASIRIDDSLTCEELAEISSISEELDSAEDFPLIVQHEGAQIALLQTLNTSDQEPTSSNDSTSDAHRRIHAMEREIRDLAKRIVSAKEEFPYSWCWERKNEQDIYNSQEYLNFSSRYRESSKLPVEGIVPPPVRRDSKRGKRAATQPTSSVASRLSATTTKKKSRTQIN